MDANGRFKEAVVPRISDTKVKEIVHSIGALRDMFKDFGSYEGDLFGVKDYTDGILYLSRLNSDAHRPESKLDEGRKKMMDIDDNTKDLQETKSEKTTTMTTQSREKKRRFAMSLATLASKPSKRVKMCADGAIQAIIKLSLLNDSAIRRSCATSFSYLASEPTIRARMIEEGAFGAIITLSSVVSRNAKADCCRALCNLCCEDGYEHRFVKEGGPYALVQIASANPNCVEICLKTLLNISCVPDKFTRLEEVTDTLMHFQSLDLTDREQILLLSAMCNLSALRNNQLRLVEDGCLRVLERVVKSPVPVLRVLASVVVRNLTTEVRTRSKLMDQNIVYTLLGMSKDELEPVKTSCVQAFYNLSRDGVCREKVVSGGAVAVIIKMSMAKLSNVERDRTASRTLRILCGDRILAQKLVREGIVKALMSLIKTDDGYIRQYCAESICSLFQNEAVLGKLIDQGAVGVLVSLSQNNTDTITGEWCSFAHYHLATNKLCPVTMLANGILPCLIKLCDVSTVRTKQFCGAALQSITQQKTVDASSAIPILVDMLRHETDELIKTSCASALYNLADSDSHCDLMLSAGALMPVVRLTQSDYMQTKIKCAAILSRLSLHEQYYSQFGMDDVLHVLLELSCVEHTLTQRRVVIAMSNLSQFKDLRLMLLKLEATKYIIALASKPDEQIRRGCAAIICNLSYDDGGERNMVHAGIISTLLITALVTSDQIQTKIICVKALVNLQRDRTLYKMMVDQGIIWGLSTLALLDDNSILILCSKALCNLSCDYAHQMLTSAVAIKAIMKLLNQSHVNMQKNAGRALMNLLLQTTDADEDFRRCAVKAIQPMAQTKDEEVSEMCILCLCLTSQSESCRENIVNSGMLTLLDTSTIFNKPTVSYAYLTMFGNIANNPLMRIKLLDDHSMARFMHICKSNDAYLDMAVAKALYCISCAPENIPKLAKQNTLPIIDIIMNANYKKSKELVHHLIACLYNMTTYKDCQYLLVSQGIVRVFTDLWPLAREDLVTCRLTCFAVCQLGCGNVNSAQMVEDGCTKILTFVTCYKNDAPKYSHYNFPADLNERCAAALRNLLCVISNQNLMVQHGVIKTLVNLALPDRQSAPLPSKTIRQNCASALRSMTYNNEMRQELVESGAITIILNDLSLEAEEDVMIGSNLLRELEAESWSNGSRGRQKEGRSSAIDPAPIYTDLLGGTPNVVLDVHKSYTKLEKYLVRVHLEEPPIDVETDGNSSSRGGSGIAHGLKDLTSFVDTEDTFVPPVQSQPKQECDVVEGPLHRKSFMESIGDHTRSAEIEEAVLVGEELGASSYLETGEAAFESTEDTSDSFYDSCRQSLDSVTSSAGAAEGAMRDRDRSNTDSRRQRKMSNGAIKTNNSKSVAFAQDPEVLPAISSLERKRQETNVSNKLKMKASQSAIDLPKMYSLSQSSITRANKEEMFKGLVALINHSKAKGTQIDAVVDKWTSMSKY